MTDAGQKSELDTLLGLLDLTRTWLDELPYSVQIHIEQAKIYQRLGYPDLAAGAAYKVLLLNDAINDDCDDYHEQTVLQLLQSCEKLPAELRTSWQAWPEDIETAFRSLSVNDPTEDGDSDDEADIEIDENTLAKVSEWASSALMPSVYHLLATNLLTCQCYRSAYKYCQFGLQHDKNDSLLTELSIKVLDAVRKTLDRSDASAEEILETLEKWPDAGLVRRELYAWNDVEPDRFSQESLDFLNEEMAKCAPKLEVKAVDLPVLTGEGEALTVKQLGVFAREDIAPGELVLSESTLLTATTRLQDALCDACNKDIQGLGKTGSLAKMCYDCSAIFCSQECLDEANELYHPAVCDRAVDKVGRNVGAERAVDSLYMLLLLRSFALAETQELHPLEIKEVKYIWGDYHFADVRKTWTPATSEDPFSSLPRSLVFDFDSSVVLPYTMLTKMDVDFYTEHRRYDAWIFNTLYAKFRGTASARLSGKSEGGLKLSRKRAPEVSAVHPCWCLANHSCDPNVQWEWGGRVEFTTREKRVEWKREATGETRAAGVAGLKQGEEVLNHYCDINLDVKLRREWAQGALGGDCKCERCIWEANEERTASSVHVE